MNSPIKWHGGKHYLARQIVGMMPPHVHYVEPYAGSLAVLLAKDPEGVSEVVNDRHGPLMNFWECLAHPPSFEEFARTMQAVPCCEELFRKSLQHLSKPCGADPGVICQCCARAFFLVVRQSMAGRMQDFTPLARTRTRRGMNELPAAWLGAVQGLPAVHARLARVVILNREAMDVITTQDGPDTLFYLDPPYLDETRKSPKVYKFEMSRRQHEELLALLRQLDGKFMLSGYPSELYESAARKYGWKRADIDVPNHAAGGGEKRRMRECVWMNY